MTIEDVPEPAAMSHAQRTVWDRSAATYVADFAALTGQSIDALLDGAGVRAGSRVLDVASGPGIVARAAADRGAVPIGIDFAPEMVAAAASACADIEFRQADATDLPFDDGIFDAVVIGFGLHHMAQPRQALAEAFRVMRPGGGMAFTVWDAMEKLDAFMLVFTAIGEVVGAPEEESEEPPLFGVADDATLLEVVESTGFTEVSITRLPLMWELSRPDAVYDAISAWADLGALPDDAAEQIRSHVASHSEAYRDGDHYRIPNPAILVTGRKA